MGLVDAGRNSMLSGGLASAVTYLSIHSADPGATGANEIAGGTPAYARKPVAWNAASAGKCTNNAAITFDVPAATSVLWLGMWSALTAGTYLGAFPAGAQAAKIGVVLSGDVTGDTIESVGHGYAAGDRIVFSPAAGVALPAGLSSGVIYYVLAAGLTTDAFKVSLTAGGAAVDVTGEGPLIVQRCVPEVFGGQGSYTVADQGATLDATLV